MSTTEMALIPLQDYKNFCTTIRHWLGTTEETKEITSGEAYWMLLHAFQEAGKHQENEDWLLTGGVRDEYVNDRVKSIRAYTFYYASNNASSFVFPNVIGIGTGAFRNSSAVKSIKVPKCGDLGSSAFQACSNLEFLDLGFTPSIIGSATFQSSAKLKTIVLRKDNTPTTLANRSSFSGTPFASDGEGGKIYVPEALIESYKTATNWSTLVGYGTCEFVPLEGSEYE